MNRRSVGLLLALAWLVACGGRGSAPSPMPPAGQLAVPRPQTTAGSELPEPPVVRAVNGVAKFTLTAENNLATGQPTFNYEGVDNVNPTIDVKPGDTFEITLIDDLPTVPPPAGMQAQGAMEGDGAMPAGTGVQEDINLHFHGLGSSPKRPGDDVLTMLAAPGQTLHYVVHIPINQEPGLYWYHPHVHGETNLQVGESGMSGAIVVEGIERHLPGLAKMKQRLIIVRATGIGDDVRPLHTNTAPCTTKDHLTTTLNGAYRPDITIAPGEKQFFRVLNATGHKTLRLNIEGETVEVVAIDGYALDAYPGTPPTLTERDVIIPPAARAEFVVTGPASGHARFRTLCYDTGPNGDPDPEILLGRLVAPSRPAGGDFSNRPLTVGSPEPRNVYTTALPPPSVKRLVVLTENAMPRFFINGKAYNPNSPPMFVVHVGTVEEWHVVNATEEIHDFHIHQIHFVVEKINGVKVEHPHWADSFIVPHSHLVGNRSVPGSLDLLMDFRDPLIKGEFVFHCHILDHEDQGMMAKIEAI
jgi:FtsP/CotA-like multicopper oxidase with cupredoxin domain